MADYSTLNDRQLAHALLLPLSTAYQSTIGRKLVRGSSPFAVDPSGTLTASAALLDASTGLPVVYAEAIGVSGALDSVEGAVGRARALLSYLADHPPPVPIAVWVCAPLDRIKVLSELYPADFPVTWVPYS